MQPILEPGSDGDSAVSFEASGFREWRRGAVYTVRPAKTLPEDRPYRILVGVRGRIAKDDSFASYSGLYQRAAAITGIRLADFAAMSPRSWTAAHAWGRHDGALSFAFASITTMLTGGQQREAGLPAPSSAELTTPGGKMPAPDAALSPSRYFDEIYNDFSFGSGQELVLFSYGEYVASAGGFDFVPCLAEAERCAKLHHQSLERPADFRILRREWFFAGDANETQAVAHIYFQA